MRDNKKFIIDKDKLNAIFSRLNQFGEVEGLAPWEFFAVLSLYTENLAEYLGAEVTDVVASRRADDGETH